MAISHQTRTRNHIIGRGAYFAVATALLFMILQPLTAVAHPMGNFSINRYSRLEITPQVIEVFHILDLAEIPTHTERRAMDSDGDDQISERERDKYLAGLQEKLAEYLYLEVNGEAVALQPTQISLSMREGQADLPILRIESRWRAEIAASDTPNVLVYQDNSYTGRIGWREIIAAPQGNVSIEESTVPQRDLSDELRSFPAATEQPLLAVDNAEVIFMHRGSSERAAGDASNDSGSVQLAGAAVPSGLLEGAESGFTDLLHRDQFNLLAVLIALSAAFGWGALHALSPGHGKSIAGAYLVGSRGTARHALFLGVTTTIAHTTGVFVMGIVALAASQFIVPEQLFPWFSLISGVLVVLIGLTMIRQRFGSGGHHSGIFGHSHQHQDSSHVHDHNHDHGHEFSQIRHHHEPGHHHHDGQHRTHGSDGHHYLTAAHDHGHSHMPPGADGSPITWRSLLALGVSGGIIPCPSALIVMLGAVALGKIAFGLLLIVVFSIGLASVLTAVGIMVVHSGRLLQHVPQSNRFVRWIPVASAAFITVVGVGITVRAIGQMGGFLP